MSGVNYLLLFKGNSDKAGPESSVRGFSKLEAAQAAMAEEHRRYATALNIPVYRAASDPHTTKTKNGIRLERYGDWFQWEIIEAVPEDGGADNSRQHGLAKYTVTIEEHIAQEFSVNARDIFHAVQAGEAGYERGKFVVQPATPNARLIMARNDETGEMTEWKEF